MPAQQQRVAAFEDYPPPPVVRRFGARFGFGCLVAVVEASTIRRLRAGDVYCRVPQDSPFNVRGARNIPCETKPGKRARRAVAG